MGQGNILAYGLLTLWPILAIRVYQKKTIQEATLWVLFGGFMILPVGTLIDFPLIPALGKHSMPVLSVVIGCWLIKKQKIKIFRNKGLVQVFVLLLFTGTFITAELNSDSIIFGKIVLHGLTLHDAISAVIGVFIPIIPFFIGKQFFRSYNDQLLMFRFLVFAGLIYTIPMLYEIRMSPQLHTIFYGYFPHKFNQQVRDGGFRPVVFMGHGLWVAFFTACVLTAAAALWSINEKIRKFSPAKVCYYLVIVLVSCKSMASLIYGAFALIAIKMLSYQMQIRVAVMLVILALLYPVMSITKTFPHEKVTQLAAIYMGEDRAQSLQFRFDNERILLNHAKERFFFGWGGWGRNRVYDEKTGKDLSVTDGRWIITLGTTGFIGFISKFGLLAIAVLRAKKAMKFLTKKNEKILLSAQSLLVAIIMIDQLPNASLAPWLWLLVGGLLGRSESIIVQSK